MKRADMLPCVRFVEGTPAEVGRAIPSPWASARHLLNGPAVAVEEVRGIGLCFVLKDQESARRAWNGRSA